jgi:DNA-directed RNA polymerase alpha subunit
MYFLEAIHRMASHNEHLSEIISDPDKFKYNRPIEELGLSKTVLAALKAWGYMSVGDLLDVLRLGQNTLLNVRHINQETLTEILQRLEEQGHWSKA